MSSRTLLENVKRRLWMFLSPEVAAVAGLQVQDLQFIISGTLTPTPAQLDALAKRMSLDPNRYPDTAEDAEARKRAIRQGVV